MPPVRGLAPELRLVRSESEAADQAGASEIPDDALVSRVAKHDSGAFEALYRRHAPFALNLAVRIQGSTQDVEDVVHDAFLRAHQRLDELRDASAFRSWLGSIVVRLVRTRLRRRRLLSVLGVANPEPVDLEAIASAEASPESRAELAQIYALLQTLPPDERIAWTLRYVERHRLEGVAELTGCSLATAKRRIAKAQRYLEHRFVAPFTEES
jgi:RNA polymerase sigma-70 factor (ECF subfamily)